MFNPHTSECDAEKTPICIICITCNHISPNNFLSYTLSILLRRLSSRTSIFILLYLLLVFCNVFCKRPIREDVVSFSSVAAFSFSSEAAFSILVFFGLLGVLSFSEFVLFLHQSLPIYFFASEMKR